MARCIAAIVASRPHGRRLAVASLKGRRSQRGELLPKRAENAKVASPSRSTRAAMHGATLMARWEPLCAAAVTLFSFSGALIMPMPTEDRRTLFIFPTFLSVVVGGSLVVYGYENFGVRTIAGPIVVPVLLVLLTRRFLPGWLLTLMSYLTLVAAVICADLLLEASAFR